MYIRTTVFLRKRAGATRLLWLDGFFYGRDLTKDPWAWAQKQGAPPRQRVAIPFLPHRAPADREPAVTTHAQTWCTASRRLCAHRPASGNPWRIIRLSSSDSFRPLPLPAVRRACPRWMRARPVLFPGESVFLKNAHNFRCSLRPLIG